MKIIFTRYRTNTTNEKSHQGNKKRNAIQNKDRRKFLKNNPEDVFKNDNQ